MTQMRRWSPSTTGSAAARALIAWSEIRHGIHLGGAMPLEELIPTLLAGIIGSVSFWGSNIASPSFQDLIPTARCGAGQQIIKRSSGSA